MTGEQGDAMKIKLERTHRGFQAITPPASNPAYSSLGVHQSSAIDDTDRGMENPGGSYLWIGGYDGEDAHLDRDAVRELVSRLSRWLETGKLFSTDEETE